MIKVKLLTLMILLKIGCVFGQDNQQSCNRKTPFRSLEKKIDSVICIPDGNIIVNLFEVDIDAKGGKDKIIKWFNEYPRVDGDTTFFSIYLHSEEGLKFYKTYSNLAPIYFEMKSLSYDVVLEDSTLNELKSIYINPHSSVVKFGKGEIVLEFQLAAREYQKLFFVFYKPNETFVLTKAEYYFSDRADGLYKELINVDIFKLEEGLEIEKFDYLDFIYK